MPGTTLSQSIPRLSGIIACKRRLQPSDVDDVVQDVMASVAKAIPDFDYDRSRGRFRAWLGTIAANRIKTFLAKRARQGQTTATVEDNGLPVDDRHWSDPDNDWVEIFSERIFRMACNRVRPHISDVTWKSFEATWIQNEPATSAAKMLGIPVHSIYVNKSRVLKRLEAEVRLLADDIPIAKGQATNLP